MAVGVGAERLCVSVETDPVAVPGAGDADGRGAVGADVVSEVVERADRRGNVGLSGNAEDYRMRYSLAHRVKGVSSVIVSSVAMSYPRNCSVSVRSMAGWT